MPRPWLLVCLLLPAAAAAARGDTFEVTLAVADAAGKPVPNATAATSWHVAKGVMTPYGDKPPASDAAGRAVLRLDDWGEKRPVLVMSADRALGGIAGVSKADAGKTVAVTLGPVVRVKGTLTCTELGRPPTWSNTTATPAGFRSSVVDDLSTPGRFGLALPAGKYRLWAYGTDVQGKTWDVDLAADKPARDLGAVDLRASTLAKLKGKPAPDWEVTAARGVKPGVKLADFKGKWVYLEFWSFG